jgi:hypothetical protein
MQTFVQQTSNRLTNTSSLQEPVIVEEKKTTPLAAALREKARVSQDHALSAVLNAIADTLDDVEGKSLAPVPLQGKDYEVVKSTVSEPVLEPVPVVGNVTAPSGPVAVVTSQVIDPVTGYPVSQR